MDTKDTFLPAGYEMPESPSDYTKLKKGANKLRILSAPIVGFEYWDTNRKPVRSRTMWNTTPKNADLKDGWNPKHFWAMVVWNHDTKSVQIWQPTQKTILTALQQLIANDDWGDPRGYNITINRSGDGLETEYALQPSPHSEVSSEIKQAYQDKPINLEALYEGGNPFDATARSENQDREDFTPVVADHEGEHPEDGNSEDVPF